METLRGSPRPKEAWKGWVAREEEEEGEEEEEEEEVEAENRDLEEGWEGEGEVAGEVVVEEALSFLSKAMLSSAIEPGE
jgi:hypothetical protein